MNQSTSGAVFVVGIWRSGTSLLHALLNKHSRIALMYEGEIPLSTSLFSRNNPDWAVKWDFWNAALTRHHIDPGSISHNVHDVSTATELVCKTYAGQKGADIWGCKSPNYYDRLTWLAAQFRSSRFIIIWRNPADVCRSVIRAAAESYWFSRRGMTIRVLLAYSELKKQCDSLVRRGVPVHQLYYDDLVCNPKQAMLDICQFLQISYEPQIASLDGADRSAVYDGGHHALVKGEAIIPMRHNAEVLSSALKEKIQHYLALWRESYGSEWRVCSCAPDNLRKPYLCERASDLLAYKFWRLLDEIPRLVYGFTPLWIWKRYRVFKRQHMLGSSLPRPILR